MEENELKKRVKFLLYTLIVIIIIGTYLGLSEETMKFIVDMFQSLIVGVILSFVAGSLIEAFTGDLLKKYFLVIPIKGNLSISISTFFIATILLKILLFH